MDNFSIKKESTAWGNLPFENTRASKMLDGLEVVMCDYLCSIFSDFLHGKEEVDMEEAYGAIRIMHIMGEKTPMIFNTNLFDQAISAAKTILMQEHWLDRFPNPAQVRIYITKLMSWLTNNRLGITSFEPVYVDEEQIKKDTTMIIRRKDTKIFTAALKKQIRRETGQYIVKQVTDKKK
jgi:hypothetical protein